MKITVKNRAPAELESVRVVKRDEAQVGGRELCFWLLELCSGDRSELALAVSDREETVLRVLDPSADADKLYELVLLGGVAPCTLNDVIDDLLAETIS